MHLCRYRSACRRSKLRVSPVILHPDVSGRNLIDYELLVLDLLRGLCKAWADHPGKSPCIFSTSRCCIILLLYVPINKTIPQDAQHSFLAPKTGLQSD